MPIHSKMIAQNFSTKNDRDSASHLITLSAAAKLTPYDANYLGLLVRKGRLRATKQKGMWYTTEEDIAEYMNRVSASALSHYGYSEMKKKWGGLIFGIVVVGTLLLPLLLTLGESTLSSPVRSAVPLSSEGEVLDRVYSSYSVLPGSAQSAVNEVAP